MKIYRSIGAIIAGLVTALALIVITEVVTGYFHPFPVGVDTTDQAVVAAHVANFPHWVLAIGAIVWFVAAFLSTWVATRLGTARHPAHGILIGALLLLAAVLNMFLLPYPVWFVVVNVLGIPLAIYLGVKFGRAPESIGDH